MAAIDVQIAARARVQRGVCIQIVGIARARFANGAGPAVQITGLGQPGELVPVATGIGIVAIDVSGCRTDRLDRPRRIVDGVTAGALIGVRHRIGKVLAAAIVCDQRQAFDRAGALQAGLGLFGIPDIGQGQPAALAVHQDSRLDQADTGQVQPVRTPAGGAVQRLPDLAPGLAARIVEGLGDDRADGQVETIAFAIPAGDAFGHPDRALLVRIVGKEGGDEVVGDDSVRENKLASVRAHHAPVAEQRRIALGDETGRGNLLAAAGGGQQGQERNKLFHMGYSAARVSSTAGRGGRLHWCWSVTTVGLA